MRIEVIGLDPPCEKCAELLENTRQAVREAGIEATIEKKWTLLPEILNKYGLLSNHALVIEGLVVSKGKVYKPGSIRDLLTGM